MTTVKLSQPIEIDGMQVKSLKFRDFNFGDIAFVATAQNEFDGVRTMVSRMAGILSDAVDQLSMADFKKISAALDTIVKPHLN